MRFLLALLLAVAAFTPSRPAAQQTASAAEASRYVGLRFQKSLPAGLKWVGGALVSHPYEDAEQYGLSEVHRGRVKMLWFEFMTGRDGAGQPHWEVKDVFLLPRTRRHESLIYSSCFSGGKPDREIVAVVDHRPDVEFFTRVSRAWRANRATGKFEAIPTKGIKCENAGYGM